MERKDKDNRETTYVGLHVRCLCLYYGVHDCSTCSGGHDAELYYFAFGQRHNLAATHAHEVPPEMAT